MAREIETSNFQALNRGFSAPQWSRIARLNNQPCLERNPLLQAGLSGLPGLRANLAILRKHPMERKGK